MHFCVIACACAVRQSALVELAMHHTCAHLLASLLLSTEFSDLAHGRQPVAPPQTAVRTVGGEIQIYWNAMLLDNLGLRVTEVMQSHGKTSAGFDRFGLTQDSQLTAFTQGHSLRGLSDGAMYVLGGYTLAAVQTSIALHDFTFRIHAEDNSVFDVISATGQRPFFADHVMAEPSADGRSVAVRTMDLRISLGLAQSLDKSEIVGWQVATVRVVSPIDGAAVTPAAEVCPSSTRWPGMPVPNHPDQIYQADILFPSLALQMTGCQHCTGPQGQGHLKLSPVTLLRNNVNDNSLMSTVVADPGGTSSARFSADVPWRTMFSRSCPPYGNDQHPFLVWNLYRISATGQLEQLGRSGVKHSHIATNGECLENPASNHILGRGCSDAYGTGDNDAPGELGPRSEIIPATGQWGRCGSIYDPACTGNPTEFHGYDESAYRLIVSEAMISPENNIDAHYFFEGWYVVRDDINPYNSMASLPFAMSWYAKNKVWTANAQAASALGPVIDRWVDPFHPAPGTLSRELMTVHGRIKVAMRATPLTAGRYRYDYAVMNVDFAIAKTSGKAPNLKIISTHGLSGFEIPLPTGVKVEQVTFADVERNSADQWTAMLQPGRVHWKGKSKNELTWGTLFRFSINASGHPGLIKLVLDANTDTTPRHLTIESLGPTLAQ